MFTHSDKSIIRSKSSNIAWLYSIQALFHNSFVHKRHVGKHSFLHRSLTWSRIDLNQVKGCVSVICGNHFPESSWFHTSISGSCHFGNVFVIIWWIKKFSNSVSERDDEIENCKLLKYHKLKLPTNRIIFQRDISYFHSLSSFSHFNRHEVCASSVGDAQFAPIAPRIWKRSIWYHGSGKWSRQCRGFQWRHF